MDRHLRHMQSGTRVIYNADTIDPEAAGEGVALCPMPVSELTDNSRNAVMQNTVALGVIVALLRMEFKVLEAGMQLQFGSKGQAVVDETSPSHERDSTTPPSTLPRFRLTSRRVPSRLPFGVAMRHWPWAGRRPG